MRFHAAVVGGILGDGGVYAEDGMANTIMFVDDERQILRALNRLFMDSSYETVFMDSGEEGLAYLAEKQVHLVISDIRMPGMNGIDFLKEIKARYPSIMRVALSGYTDSRIIYKALEENVAKMYLFKPWDNRELLLTIDRMFRLEEVLTDKKIMNLINNLSDIPTLPSLYQRIRTMIQDDEDVDRIAELIEADQSASAKILRIANSAFYGAKTGSISQAIMYIGLSNVRSIVLSSALFSGPQSANDAIKRLWSHSTLTNRLTSHLYQRATGRRIPNVFASAGLLHNIGMAIMISYFPKEYEKIMAGGYEEPDTAISLESDILGVTHQELGGYLLNWWELPLPIVEAALYHHSPLEEGIINRELLAVVHLANWGAWNKLGVVRQPDDRYTACLDALRLTAEDLTQCFDEVEVSNDNFD